MGLFHNMTLYKTISNLTRIYSRLTKNYFCNSTSCLKRETKFCWDTKLPLAIILLISLPKPYNLSSRIKTPDNLLRVVCTFLNKKSLKLWSLKRFVTFNKNLRENSNIFLKDQNLLSTSICLRLLSLFRAKLLMSFNSNHINLKRELHMSATSQAERNTSEDVLMKLTRISLVLIKVVINSMGLKDLSTYTWSSSTMLVLRLKEKRLLSSLLGLCRKERNLVKTWTLTFLQAA